MRETYLHPEQYRRLVNMIVPGCPKGETRAWIENEIKIHLGEELNIWPDTIDERKPVLHLVHNSPASPTEAPA